MKKSIKIGSIVFGGILTLGLLTGCNSFCSSLDTSHYRYANDPINTTFYSAKEDAYTQIFDTFLTANNVDENRVTKENLVYTNDQGSFYYKDDAQEFENQVFNVYNENLVSLNAGDIKIEKVTTAEEEKDRQDVHFYIGLNPFTAELFNAANNGQAFYTLPSYKVIDLLDQKLLEEILELNSTLSLETLTYSNIYGYSSEDFKKYNSLEKGNEKETLLKEMKKDREEKSLLANYGYLKHYSLVTDEKGNEVVDYTKKIKEWNNEIGLELENGAFQIMTTNYLTNYETKLAQKVAQIKTCISVDDGFYGNVGNDPLNTTVKVEGKAKDFWGDWGKAFSEHGFLEGLLVYPIGVSVENLSHALGMNGWGQIGALIIVTIIVRLLFMAITFPSTLSQTKMTALQPEIAKLNQKYPNSQTNQYDKQKLAEAQMALYKKHKVHPFRNLLVMVIQFPLFISVWNALSGSASLSTDAVLGLNLSASIWNTLTNFSGWPANPGWWSALVLIIIMSTAQIFQMLIPQMLQKRNVKNVTKLNKSEALDKQQKQMKIMQWVMTIFIIFMGFTLPAAMGVYWFTGAIFSIFQSIIMHYVVNINKNKKPNKK